VSKIQGHIGTQLTFERDTPEVLGAVVLAMELVGLGLELAKTPVNAVFAKVVLSGFRKRLSVFVGGMTFAVVGTGMDCVEASDVENVANWVAMFA